MRVTVGSCLRASKDFYLEIFLRRGPDPAPVRKTVLKLLCARE
jgi:hypothetical protein